MANIINSSYFGGSPHLSINNKLPETWFPLFFSLLSSSYYYYYCYSSLLHIILFGQTFSYFIIIVTTLSNFPHHIRNIFHSPSPIEKQICWQESQILQPDALPITNHYMFILRDFIVYKFAKAQGATCQNINKEHEHSHACMHTHIHGMLPIVLINQTDLQGIS